MNTYLADSPFGWALHEVIRDEAGKVVDYVFRKVNPAFGELTGLIPAEIEGKRATEVIPHLRDGDFDWVDYYGRLALEGGSELIEQHAEALGRWYMVHAWSKGDGFFTTLFFDVTTMREQSEELAGFFQVNLDLLCIADTDGRFIKVNPQWASVLGYSEDELESRYFLDFVHPDDLEATLEAIKELSAQKDVLNFVNRYRSKDGAYRWIEWRSHPRGKLIYAAARDISARKASEEFIETHSRMQDLLIRLSTRFINAPHDEEAVVINEALAEIGRFAGADRAYIFSYDHEKRLLFNTYEWCEEGVEAQIDKLQNISWDDAPEWLERHFAGQNMVIEGVQALPAGSLTRRILEDQGVVSLIAVPLMDRGTAVGFLGFDSVNIVHLYSERETVILTMFAGMLVNLMKRCALEESLVESKEEADRASRIKAEFLANMSHEIRTPMNAISGFGRLLADHRELPADALSLVQKINSSSRLLLGIINDILDYSKIEAGKLELDPYPFCLSDIVEQLTSLFDDSARAKGLDFVIEQSPDMPDTLMGDALRLIQVLVNLLGNAIKFTQKGRVVLRVSTCRDGFEAAGVGTPGAGPGEGADCSDISPAAQTGTGAYCVDVNPAAQIGNATECDDVSPAPQSGTTAPSLRLVCFEVCDTGRGIPPNELSRLFTAFSQGDTSTTRKFGGTGLGLVIASRLVEAMGGRLRVDSVWGEGSRFHFCVPLLPLAPERLATSSSPNLSCEDLERLSLEFIDRRAQLHAPSKQLPDLSGYRLLLVEDNGLGREVAMRLLSKTGARIDVAVNGQEAVDRADPRKHDLILMDIQMPLMDGYEAASRILLEHPGLPVVALSAAVTEEDRAQSRAGGMVDHLAKPMDEAALANLFERILLSGRRPVDKTPDPAGPLVTSTDKLPEHGAPYQTNSSSSFPGFDQSLPARLAGSEGDFEYSIRALFREQLENDFKGLPALLSGNPSPGSMEHEAALQQAHALKGVAGAVLATHLASSAGEAEDLLRKGAPIPDALAGEFHCAMAEALGSLYRMLAGRPTRPDPALSDAPTAPGAPPSAPPAGGITQTRARTPPEDRTPTGGVPLAGGRAPADDLLLLENNVDSPWLGLEAPPSILVVDDQAINAASLSRILGGDSRVAQADSGRAALAYIGDHGPPDIILLDISMPEMDGYELCCRLKAEPETRDIPVIFITARGDPEDEEKGFRMGAADYIVKPFHETVIRARVRNQLRLKRNSQALRDIALRDGLTGIPNRRSWDERFDVLWRHTLRNATPAAVFMVDIDHFKAFNDNYGHGDGDECLRAVAATLSKSLLRPLELVARYGGEEFAAFLPETDTVGAVQVAKRMLEAVRALAIPHHFSSAAQVVTVSIGMACCEPGPAAKEFSGMVARGIPAADVLKLADAALYRAKALGRNRMECENLNLI